MLTRPNSAQSSPPPAMIKDARDGLAGGASNVTEALLDAGHAPDYVIAWSEDINRYLRLERAKSDYNVANDNWIRESYNAFGAVFHDEKGQGEPGTPLAAAYKARKRADIHWSAIREAIAVIWLIPVAWWWLVVQGPVT